MLDALAPGHLADVNEAFDARLELDKRAVVGEADHLAAHAGAHRIPIHDVRPGIGDELLVAERHTLGRRIVLEHDHVDRVVHLEELGGMADAPPRHVRDMEQAVDAAQIDERAVVGDVLDDALDDLALGQDVERVLLLLRVLFLEQGLPRQHDVPALLVDLDHAHAQLLAAQRVEVADGTDIDLRPGQERAHADIDGEPALDPLDDPADDDLALRIGLLDLVPNLHLLRFFAGEDDVAFAVFGAFEEDVHDVAGLNRDLALFVEELAHGDDAFGLVADVDHHFRGGHLENRSLDDLTFRDVPEAGIVACQQLGVFGGIDLVIVLARTDLQPALVGAGASFRAFARRDAAAWSGNVLIFCVRHALRVLLCRSIAG